MSKETDRKYMVLGFKIVGDFGATIAVPVVLFAYLGRRVDTYFSTSGPWFTILGFILAATVTTVMIRRKAKAYGKEYTDLIAEESKSKHPHSS